MNTMIAHCPAGLADPPRRDTCAATSAGPDRQRLHVPIMPPGNRVRAMASETAMLVAVLAFVLAFVALRFTLLREQEFVEQVAIPVASGAGVVSAVALLCAFVLRHGTTRGS